MTALVRRQQVDWSRAHAIGQKRFVLLIALAWFVLVGLVPLPYLQAHTIVPDVVPIVLACVLICGLLIGDVAWHHVENGFLEQTGAASARQLEHRQRTLWRFVILPLVLLAIDLFFDIPQPGKLGVVLGALGALAILMAALVLLERSMRLPN
jgi:hypothetical protein